MNKALIIDKEYALLLNDLKQKIKTAQLKAHRAVNTELIRLYWSIGKELLERQKIETWGSKYLDQVSRDLKAEFPGTKGFSKRNLEYMRKFSDTFEDDFTQQPAAQLGWGSLMVVLDKNLPKIQRNWYAQQALQEGWSRNVLNLMIKQDLYTRQAEAPKITNFKETLPAVQSDMAQQMFKDPYCFEFLTIDKPAHERAIENALVNQIRDFLLELGQGFAFVGNQYRLNVGGDDFYIDCLFYNLKMRCYVVIELKSRKFKPEYSGQLNFYLTAVDREIKAPQDQPTIGILLCETKNEVVAQYSVDGMTKPMGISQYELGEALTARLKSLSLEKEQQDTITN